MMKKNRNQLKKHQSVFDIQGHRGCRGLLPENTIPGFIKALELGVSTLELDVVISKDHKVVVSHEPFFNHEISTHPHGFPITKKNELDFNIYKLAYSEIRKFDVGSKLHKRFKAQEKIATYKPLLSELIATITHKNKELKLAPPYFNIEIKRKASNDNIFHPSAEVFANLVMTEIKKAGISEKTSVQSFDIDTLELIHNSDPSIPLVYLVEQNSAKKNLKNLSFIPAIYSPHYSLVNKKLVKFCHKKGMLLIPWTVNKKKKMKQLIELGVNGIISDYPDKLLKVVRKNKGLIIK